MKDQLRAAIMRGEFEPTDALKPQELALRCQVSLAAVREALVRLVGDGLAERLPNRGFAAPALTDRRWQTIMEAWRTVEPPLLRLAIELGDLEWETRVRAAQHRLSRTPMFAPTDSVYYSDSWAEAQRHFHRTLLDGCGNHVLVETFDRLWTASELVGGGRCIPRIEQPNAPSWRAIAASSRLPLLVTRTSPRACSPSTSARPRPPWPLTALETSACRELRSGRGRATHGGSSARRGSR